MRRACERPADRGAGVHGDAPAKGLLLTNDFPPMTGGEATWYARLCAALPPEAVVVLAPHVPGDRAFDARQPYRIVRRRVPVSPHPVARLAQVALLLWHAWWIARRERVRAVHVGHLYLGPVAQILRWLLGLPYVLYLHGGELAAYMRWGIVREAARAVVGGARLVVTNSDYTRRMYQSLGVRHRRTTTVTIGVDGGRFRPGLDPRGVRARYGLDGARVILTVGRLVERKGHDTIIRALDRVRAEIGPVRYLVAGRGPEEERLRALARDLGVADAVVFAGRVPDEELPFLYAACDVFAMPSREIPERDGVEGFGIVFLEAGACGKPVIGGRSGGVADAVADGQTGVLVNPHDVDDVAAALVRLLRDPQLAARLGAEGRRRAEAAWSEWPEALARAWTEAGGTSDGA